MVENRMNTSKGSTDTARSFGADYGPAVVSVCSYRTLGFDPDGADIPQFTILIVGCQAQDLHRFRHALESAKLAVDVQVHMASGCGAELEDFLAAAYYKPSLILLDCGMRSELSLAIVRGLKGNPKTRNIPVIALAQPGDDLYVENLYRCEVNCVLAKPRVAEEATALFTRIEQFWFRVAALPVSR
jgi:CheY-like chemotaxis protein